MAIRVAPREHPISASGHQRTLPVRLQMPAFGRSWDRVEAHKEFEPYAMPSLSLPACSAGSTV